MYRFYDPTAGASLIDGQPIAEVPTLIALGHRHVPQDTVLFNDTVGLPTLPTAGDALP
jgi:ABC-type transport system involved in Fe-S cluster assembly fused permease/ATPase subunit